MISSSSRTSAQLTIKSRPPPTWPISAPSSPETHSVQALFLPAPLVHRRFPLVPSRRRLSHRALFLQVHFHRALFHPARSLPQLSAPTHLLRQLSRRSLFLPRPSHR